MIEISDKESNTQKSLMQRIKHTIRRVRWLLYEWNKSISCRKNTLFLCHRIFLPHLQIIIILSCRLFNWNWKSRSSLKLVFTKFNSSLFFSSQLIIVLVILFVISSVRGSHVVRESDDETFCVGMISVELAGTEIAELIAWRRSACLFNDWWFNIW